MHPYAAIKELVTPIFQRSAHEQVDEEIRPDAFGSAYSVFNNQRSKIRRDGKDGSGYAQTSSGDEPDEWEDIPFYLTEGDLESIPPNQEKIGAFLAAVEKAAG